MEIKAKNVPNAIPTALTVTPVIPLDHVVTAETVSIQSSLIVNLALIQIAKRVLIRYIVTYAKTVPNAIPTALTVTPVCPLDHVVTAETASIQSSLIVNLVLIQTAKHVLI
ncbi:hypothetical protein MAR_030517, partial [Mya arenaria]